MSNLRPLGITLTRVAMTLYFFILAWDGLGLGWSFKQAGILLLITELAAFFGWLLGL